MKQMTTKDMVLLSKDLHLAKILVLRKHGFETDEISTIMCMSESVIRNLIRNYENHNK